MIDLLSAAHDALPRHCRQTMAEGRRRPPRDSWDPGNGIHDDAHDYELGAGRAAAFARILRSVMQIFVCPPFYLRTLLLGGGGGGKPFWIEVVEFGTPFT